MLSGPTIIARFFASAVWRAFREQVFARDGYRCTRVTDGVRCPNSRRAGAQLVANHRTYDRFGGRERLEDCETLCASCDDAETMNPATSGPERREVHRYPRRGYLGGNSHDVQTTISD